VSGRRGPISNGKPAHRIRELPEHRPGKISGSVRCGGGQCAERGGEDLGRRSDQAGADLAGAGLLELVGDFLHAHDSEREAIDHWLIHPGGRRIIESVQQALSLSDEQVSISFEVLANNGNVGTPSIFYVLQRTIEQRDPAPGEHGLMVTIGPGVTVGLMLLRW